jgi:hypothetical protein
MKKSWLWFACAVLLAGLVSVRCQKAENPSSGDAEKSPAAAPANPSPPIAILDTPREGSTVPNKSWGTGWALDKSGISQVTATADNGAAVPAKIGQPFPGVKEAYPDAPDNDKAGFIFGIPDLPAGPHTLTVEVVAKNGGKVVLTRHFTVR